MSGSDIVAPMDTTPEAPSVTSSTMAARATTEVQAAIVHAQAAPRNERQAFANMMEACKRPRFAKKAIWGYRRGGQQLSGLSIRAFEMMAGYWGHVQYGIRELERDTAGSLMEAWAWDLQTGTQVRQQFYVPHVRDTRQGPVALTDSRDVYEITANMGARRLRTCLARLIPIDYQEEVMEQNIKTLAAKPGEILEPLGDRVRKMVAAFKENHAVTEAHLETQLGRSLDTVDEVDLHNLRLIYVQITKGEETRETFFDLSAENAASAEAALASPAKEPAKRKRGKKAPAKAVETAPEAPTPPDEPPLTDGEQAALEERWSGVGGPPLGGE